jgi:hypothetical protein
MVIDRGKPKFEPIVKDPKKSERQYFCVECGTVATQTALFKIEGAVNDDCASKKSQIS